MSVVLSSMEKKRKQGRGAGCTGKGLAREDLTEKMTFETNLGASLQSLRKESFRQGNSRIKEQQIGQCAWS